MKAILIRQPSDPDMLYVGETETPQPTENDLLVRVRAAGLNRADLLQRRGAYPPPPGASSILGLELAGTVERAAGKWQVGDRVMAVVTGGAYVEFAAVPAEMAMPIPQHLSFEEGAAIPEAFLTAYLNLFTLGSLQSGDVALIHAGASGVGTAAIQLAHIAGATVITTAGSDEKLARCRVLGANVSINYKTKSFAERVLEETDGHGADVILDFVGAPYWAGNLKAAAAGGRLMLIGMLGGSAGQLDISPIMSKRLPITGTTLRRLPFPQKTNLVQAFTDFALPRFATGDLKPVLDSVYPFSEAAKAHQHMEANRNIGKIVLRVDEGSAQ